MSLKKDSISVVIVVYNGVKHWKNFTAFSSETTKKTLHISDYPNLNSLCKPNVSSMNSKVQSIYLSERYIKMLPALKRPILQILNILY